MKLDMMVQNHRCPKRLGRYAYPLKSDDFALTVAKTEFIDVTATVQVIFGAR